MAEGDRMIILHRCKMPEHVARLIELKGQSLSEMLVDDAWSDFKQVNLDAYVDAYADDIVEPHIQLNNGVYTTVIGRREKSDDAEFECETSMIIEAGDPLTAVKRFSHELRYRGATGDVMVKNVESNRMFRVDTETWTVVEV